MDVDAVLRVLQACDEVKAPPVISLVFPQKGGGRSQIFLEWKKGKTIRDYIRDPKLRGKLSLSRALRRCRITDHTHRVRRSTHVPQPNDEIIISRGEQ